MNKHKYDNKLLKSKPDTMTRDEVVAVLESHSVRYMAKENICAVCQKRAILHERGCTIAFEEPCNKRDEQVDAVLQSVKKVLGASK